MKKLITALPIALSLIACSGGEAQVESTDTSAKDPVKTVSKTLPAKFADASVATYDLEKNHAFLWFEVNHNTVSNYRVNFTDFDVELDFDPADLEANAVSVSINPASLITNYPADYKATHQNSPYANWNEALGNSPDFLNAGEHPAITFKSTGMKSTGDYTGKMTGDLTFLGITKSVTMDVTYNGTGNKPWFGERDLIGFNAETVLKRTDFGMDYLLSNLGDEVTVKFSGEFLQREE